MQPHMTSAAEIEELRSLVARDLKDAAISELSADRRFATAYNTVLQLSKMAIACAGYPGRDRGRSSPEDVRGE